jgi:propionyl-CoA carboxylase beta chain
MLVTHTTDFGMEKNSITGWRLLQVRNHKGEYMFFAQDFTVLEVHYLKLMPKKKVKVMDMAVKMGAPMIGLNDSGGARIQEGFVFRWVCIFLQNVQTSGVIPQISAIMGLALVEQYTACHD